MRRRKTQKGTGTDLRKVSETVHARRRERSRNSIVLRENPEAARAAVRAYGPEERLRTIDREAQQLVEDARDIPRYFDGDDQEPLERWYWLTLRLIPVLLVANVLALIGAGICLAGPAGNYLVLYHVAALNIFTVAVVVIASLRRRRGQRQNQPVGIA